MEHPVYPNGVWFGLEQEASERQHEISFALLLLRDYGFGALWVCLVGAERVDGESAKGELVAQHID